jgi:catechol 2,3-dioxygenase-like lactoylglutathione lyase family enzyme
MAEDAIANTGSARRKPVLDLRFISHGTLECRDLQKTRRFYEDFLGFETVATSKVSFWARLGGDHVYVVVQRANVKDRPEMPFLNHNGVDVASDGEVDKAFSIVRDAAQEWGIRKLTDPSVQHGTYSFFFYDLDNNCWEILSNPKGGYGWMFERGDQEGAGHLKKTFDRPSA